MHPFTPFIIYNAIELLLSVGLDPWNTDDDKEGGSDKSAAGIPESFKIRGDNIKRVLIPFYESEHDAVAAWIDWAQSSGQTFEFWFDAEDEDTAHEVYLDSPALEQGFKPVRDSFADLFHIEIRIRTASGLPFDSSVNWSGA